MRNVVHICDLYANLRLATRKNLGRANDDQISFPAVLFILEKSDHQLGTNPRRIALNQRDGLPVHDASFFSIVANATDILDIADSRWPRMQRAHALPSRL